MIENTAQFHKGRKMGHFTKQTHSNTEFPPHEHYTNALVVKQRSAVLKVFSSAVTCIKPNSDSIHGTPGNHSTAKKKSTVIVLDFTN